MYNNLHRKRTLLIKIQRNEGLSLIQFAKKEKIHKYIYPSISLFFFIFFISYSLILKKFLNSTKKYTNLDD